MGEGGAEVLWLRGKWSLGRRGVSVGEDDSERQRRSRERSRGGGPRLASLLCQLARS